jgi:hypothetical protein
MLRGPAFRTIVSARVAARDSESPRCRRSKTIALSAGWALRLHVDVRPLTSGIAPFRFEDASYAVG